jgi:hypothetical protein
VDQDGVCLPTTECGTGTVSSGGQCVPDGSVVCEQGTVFDMASGTCVLDPDACGAGTVLVDEECIPEDDLLPGMADYSEMAEPNGPGDDNIAGMFDVPAVDAEVSIYGCIVPTADADADGNLDEDLDTWLITAAGPTVLEINADGIGGLTAGFAMLNADPANSPALDEWQRLGVNLTGDTSHRQVYLPAAGTYALLMADSRSLFLDAAGTDGACYYTTVTTRARPTPTPLTLPATDGMDSGDVKIYSYQADAAGDILDVGLATPSGAMSPGFIAVRKSQFVGNAAELFWTFGGLAPTNDLVEIVVDMEFNYALSPQNYTLTSYDIGAQALPTAGTTVVVPKKNDDTPDAPYADLNFLYFDVTGDGAVIHWDLTSDAPIVMYILRQDIFTPLGSFDIVAAVEPFGGTGLTAFQDEFVRFLLPGRYYVVAFDEDGSSGDTYSITSTLTEMTVTPVTYATPLTGQALPAQGAGFHSLDLTAPRWVEFGAVGTDLGPDVGVSLYDAAAEGWFDNGYDPVFGGARAADGSDPFGRIMVGDTRDYVIRVDPTAAPGTTPSYDLDIGDRPHVNLMTIAPGTPITRTGDTILADSSAEGSQDVARYIVMGTSPNSLSGIVTPAVAESSDIVVRRLGAAENTLGEFDGNGDGEAESFGLGFAAAPANWIAFEVGSFDDEDSTVDITLNSVAPVPYTITTGTLAWTDACTNGAELMADGDDEFTAVESLPTGWSFSFFGESVSDFMVGANGILAWGDTEPNCSGCFSNAAIPTGSAPNGIVAPYWDDLEAVRVCREDSVANDTVTLQYESVRWGTSTIVEMQIVLHMDGVIDFIYGPNHQGDGGSATVGVENLTGTFGHQVVFNQAGSVTSGTSRTLTPQ